MGFYTWKGDGAIALAAYGNYLKDNAAGGFASGDAVVAENFNAILRQESVVTKALMDTLGVNGSADSSLADVTSAVTTKLTDTIKSVVLDFASTDAIKSVILDFAYPVGSIYMTTSSDLDSASKMTAHFGGTWVAWGQGRVPVSAGSNNDDLIKSTSAETVGGSKYLQKHNHNIDCQVHQSGTHSHDVTGSASGYISLNAARSSTGTYVGGVRGNQDVGVTTYNLQNGSISGTAENAGLHTHTMIATADFAGTGGAQNIPPYITCYMWKRTS